MTIIFMQLCELVASFFENRKSKQTKQKTIEKLKENGFQMRAPHGLGSFILCLPWITAVRRREGEWWSSLQQIFCSERKERLPLLAGGRRVVLINQHDRARILKSDLTCALSTAQWGIRCCWHVSQICGWIFFIWSLTFRGALVLPGR